MVHLTGVRGATAHLRNALKLVDVDNNAAVNHAGLAIKCFPSMNLGLDFDGTIDEAPEFFSILSRIWPGLVIIITRREDNVATAADANKFDVRFDAIESVIDYHKKVDAIKRWNIKVLFDDMDEVITHIPNDVTVLKIRNGGNFENGRWLYDKFTGKDITKEPWQ